MVERRVSATHTGSEGVQDAQRGAQQWPEHRRGGRGRGAAGRRFETERSGARDCLMDDCSGNRVKMHEVMVTEPRHSHGREMELP